MAAEHAETKFVPVSPGPVFCSWPVSCVQSLLAVTGLCLVGYEVSSRKDVATVLSDEKKPAFVPDLIIK